MCKEVLDLVQRGGAIEYFPRTQIIDLAALTVLNIEPEFIVSCNYKKRVFPFLDLASALSAVCVDMAKFKNPTKKFPWDTWDLGEYVGPY